MSTMSTTTTTTTTTNNNTRHQQTIPLAARSSASNDGNNNSYDNDPLDNEPTSPSGPNSSSSWFSSFPFLDCCGTTTITILTFFFDRLRVLLRHLWQEVRSLLNAENSSPYSKGCKLAVTLYTYLVIWTKSSLIMMGAYSWLLQIHQYLLAIVAIVTLLIGAACLLWLYEFMWWRERNIHNNYWQVPSLSLLPTETIIQDDEQQQQQQQEPLLMGDGTQQQTQTNLSTARRRQQEQQQRRLVTIEDNGDERWWQTSGCKTCVRVTWILFFWSIFCYINTFLERWVFTHYMTAHPDHNFELILVNALEAVPLLFGAAYTLYDHLYPTLYGSWQVATTNDAGIAVGRDLFDSQNHSSTDTPILESLM